MLLCVVYISFPLVWERKETQLHVYWGWSWLCEITPQHCFQEAFVEHELYEGQRFVLAIDWSYFMPHVSLR